MFYCHTVIMYFLFICFICATVIADNDLLSPKYYDLSRAEEIFKQFLIKNEKAYVGEEYDNRFEIFKKNLKEINELNKDYDVPTFGVNAFTDMTSEEFSNMYSCGDMVPTNDTIDDELDYDAEMPVPPPYELDYRKWGYVSEVKDQKSCGSCYVFSAIGNIEGQYAKMHGSVLSLSEQQAMDCDVWDNGCSGGQVHNIFWGLIRTGGSMLEKDYPYEAVRRQCRTNRYMVAARVVGGGKLNVQNEQQLKTALIYYGPLSVYMYVSYKDMQHTMGQGVYKPGVCRDAIHAVTLIGYGKSGNDDYWLIKNSWGKGWGDHGFFRMVMGRNACNIGNFYAACARVA